MRARPINIRAIQRTGALDEHAFMRDISSFMNFASEEEVQRFYMAFVKAVTKRLRENGIVRLPHLGDVALLKSHKGNAGFIKDVEAFKKRHGYATLQFYFNENFLNYFKSYIDATGDTNFDPRERLLNERVTLDFSKRKATPGQW
jgi:hypothetical protein